MSDTISESLNPLNAKKVCTRSSENQPNELQDENLNLASGVLESVSNAEFNQIVQDLATDDGEFDRLLTTIDTNNMVVPGSSNTLNYANNHMTKQSMMNVPVPVFNSCSNIIVGLLNGFFKNKITSSFGRINLVSDWRLMFILSIFGCRKIQKV